MPLRRRSQKAVPWDKQPDVVIPAARPARRPSSPRSPSAATGTNERLSAGSGVGEDKNGEEDSTSPPSQQKQPKQPDWLSRLAEPLDTIALDMVKLMQELNQRRNMLKRHLDALSEAEEPTWARQPRRPSSGPPPAGDEEEATKPEAEASAASASSSPSSTLASSSSSSSSASQARGAASQEEKQRRPNSELGGQQQRGGSEEAEVEETEAEQEVVDHEREAVEAELRSVQQRLDTLRERQKARKQAFRWPSLQAEAAVAGGRGRGGNQQQPRLPRPEGAGKLRIEASGKQDPEQEEVQRGGGKRRGFPRSSQRP